jgi:adenylate cyclase
MNGCGPDRTFSLTGCQTTLIKRRPVAVEIERKYLVVGNGWRARADAGQSFRQGYLARTERGSVRVRRAGDKAFMTVKGKRRGISRSEYEYAVPVEEAEEMLRELCVKPLLEKVRHIVPCGDLTWEVDVYCGQAEGLVTAEVELTDPSQLVRLPTWIGREVTHDLRYRNSAIAGWARRQSTPVHMDAAAPQIF